MLLDATTTGKRPVQERIAPRRPSRTRAFPVLLRLLRLSSSDKKSPVRLLSVLFLKSYARFGSAFRERFPSVAMSLLCMCHSLRASSPFI